MGLHSARLTNWVGGRIRGCYFRPKFCARQPSSSMASPRDLSALPTTPAGITRLAVARLVSAGVPAAPLLKAAGLTDEMLVGHDRAGLRSRTLGLLF